MTPGTQGVLRPGSPDAAGLDPHRLALARGVLARRLPPALDAGCYPSAVLLLARAGTVGVHEAYGDAVRYGEGGRPLPAADRVPAQRDTLYDLASLTKTTTAVAVVALAERGSLSLDQPVADVLPRFSGQGKDEVVIRQLLAHTAGLPALVDLWRRPASRVELLDRAAGVPLQRRPGSGCLYSDVGPILAGAVVERVTNSRLDEVVADLVTGPLGMSDTGYLPCRSRKGRCAATEAQPWTGRAMPRGEVHDENAWALGGVSGHAGLFGTAADVALLAELLADDDGASGVLGAAAREAMLTDHGNGTGLGVRLNQPVTGVLASPATVSHTGFTGTFYVADRRTRSVGVLLTNRVHPSRDRGTVTASRAAVAEALHPATAS